MNKFNKIIMSNLYNISLCLWETFKNLSEGFKCFPNNCKNTEQWEIRVKVSNWRDCWITAIIITGEDAACHSVILVAKHSTLCVHSLHNTGSYHHKFSRVHISSYNFYAEICWKRAYMTLFWHHALLFVCWHCRVVWIFAVNVTSIVRRTCVAVDGMWAL